MDSKQSVDDVVNDQLHIQGWSEGNCIRQGEYYLFPDLASLFSKKDVKKRVKRPYLLLVDKESRVPRMVIETEGEIADLHKALRRATGEFGKACNDAGYPVLAAGVAGDGSEGVATEIRKFRAGRWQKVRAGKRPVDWIPSPADVEWLLSEPAEMQLTPVVPGVDILNEKAREMRKMLKEANVEGASCPAYAAAMVLALGHSQDRIRRDPDHVLKDINRELHAAFADVGRGELSAMLALDEENSALACSASRMLALLERLNLDAVRQSGQNIGLFFDMCLFYTLNEDHIQPTPPHITKLLVDICEVAPQDQVIDPVCGIGNFLWACRQRTQSDHTEIGEASIGLASDNIVGFEQDPLTAALCAGNLMLKDGVPAVVHPEDCFTSPNYPIGECQVALMTPHLPRRQGRRLSAPEYVERALQALEPHGKLAAIIPRRLLWDSHYQGWRRKILAEHAVRAVIELPESLFYPYSQVGTAAILIEKDGAGSDGEETMLVRLEHDGRAIRGNGLRIECSDEPCQLGDAKAVLAEGVERPGFSARRVLFVEDEWTPSRHILSPLLSNAELADRSREFIERNVDFYRQNAERIVRQRVAIERRRIACGVYRDSLSDAQREAAKAHPDDPGTLGRFFEAYRGIDFAASVSRMAPGNAMIAQPEGRRGGQRGAPEGWVDLDRVFAPPFITVRISGAIGETLVQTEPCAVGKNCLLLIPKADRDVPLARLFLAAALIQHESWRYSLSYSMTPRRILTTEMRSMPKVEQWIEEQIESWQPVISGMLEGAEQSAVSTA